MRDYKIISDCTCDLDDEYVKGLDVDIIPMDVTMEGRQFEHYLDFRNCGFKEFYDCLNKGDVASTSQINPAKYLNYFEPYLEKGLDILYVCFSSGLSSTYSSAILAANELNEKYTNKVYVVDSKGASGGEGLLLIAACKNKNEGMDVETNAKWLQYNLYHLAHWFTVNDLMFLKRGGRISGTVAVLG